MKRKIFNRLVAERDFRALFTEHLGWDTLQSTPKMVHISAKGVNIDYECVAEKSGVPIYVAKVEYLPTALNNRLIDTSLRQHANEYIAIYIQDEDTGHQLWVVNTGNSSGKTVTYEYASATNADHIFSKIDALDFTEHNVTNNTAVRKALSRAFDVNTSKLSKEFYNELRAQQDILAAHITGIDDDKAVGENDNKQTYAWLMTSRLLLGYYIQKAGLLDDNTAYLRDKLNWHVRTKQTNQSNATFYRVFLHRLFGVLSNSDLNREFEAQLGRVPYLDIKMFRQHDIESKYSDIDISDDALVAFFNFLDSWRWHCEICITDHGHDLFPETIDYALVHSIMEYEQCDYDTTSANVQVNVIRHAILSYLLERVSSSSATISDMFAPDGWIWQLVRNDSERYIIDSSRINDTLNKINSGDATIREIVANIDINVLVDDMIKQSDSLALIFHLYYILSTLKVLDPNCGYGGYLLATLDIIEPLYYNCIHRLKELNGSNDSSMDVLNEVCHSYGTNIPYNIRRYIISNNLYGVDMSLSATDLCKLRLFVRLLALTNADQVYEQQADISNPEINVKCGNMLVGYTNDASIKEDLATASDIFQVLANKEFKGRVVTNQLKVSAAYRALKIKLLTQTPQSPEVQQAQAALNKRLQDMNELLNRFTFASTGYVSTEYQDWFESQKPFNWIIEYYDVMHDNHGFDLIVGSPVSGEYNRRDSKPGKAIYGATKNLLPIDCGSMYTLVNNRCLSLLTKGGRSEIKKATPRKGRK